MKIALVYINVGLGGSGTVVLQLANHLSKIHDITIITNNSFVSFFKNVTDCAVIGIDNEYSTGSFTERIKRFLLKRLKPNYSITQESIRSVLNNNHFDVIHFHSAISLSLSIPLISGQKLIFTDHDNSFSNDLIKSHFELNTSYLLMIENLNKMDAITCPSNKNLKIVSKLVDNKAIITKTIYNGLNIPETESKPDFSKICAAFCGGTIPNKRLYLLINLLKSIPTNFLNEINFQLMIFGKTDKYLEEYISTLKISKYVTIKGLLPIEKYSKELEFANVYINISETEVFPTSLLEAAANNSIPFIINNGGILEIFTNNETCIEFNLEDFNKKLTSLGDQENLRRISENINTMKKSITWDKIALEYQSLYRAL
jgi:glycosyltransferase involved in cell wall biosynthesis